MNGERGTGKAESRKQKAESRKQKAESRKHRGGLLPFALSAAKRSRRAVRRDAASSKRLHVTHENKSRLQAGSCSMSVVRSIPGGVHLLAAHPGLQHLGVPDLAGGILDDIVIDQDEVGPFAGLQRAEGFL